MEKAIFNVVSYSGGKDSTAMLLKMIEEGIQIDCIMFCDTGLEFPQMYEHIDRIERETGLGITRVKPDMDFEYLMFDKPINRKDGSAIKIKYGADQTGHGWPGSIMRWCTKALKDAPRERFLKAFKPYYEMRYYVGIAADEQKRLGRKTNQNPEHIHPLVDWGMTEVDCLEYCYSRGYDWGGLYELFDRVSCWCCPLQSLDELRKLRANFPDLWEQLKEWDDRNFRTFRADYTVRELEKRFMFEDERIRAGKSVRGKEFMTALRERLKEGSDNGKTG